MEDLIKALQIFVQYGNPSYPTHCEHDELMIMQITNEQVSEDDLIELKRLGFELTDSRANFIFAKHSKFRGEDLYRLLKSRGILVRHFEKPRISDYLRITVGSRQQMDSLLKTLKELTENA